MKIGKVLSWESILFNLPAGKCFDVSLFFLVYQYWSERIRLFHNNQIRRFFRVLGNKNSLKGSLNTWWLFWLFRKTSLFKWTLLCLLFGQSWVYIWATFCLTSVHSDSKVLKVGNVRFLLFGQSWVYVWATFCLTSVHIDSKVGNVRFLPVAIRTVEFISEPKSQKALTNSVKWCIVFIVFKSSTRPFSLDTVNSCLTTTLSASNRIWVTDTNSLRNVRSRASRSASCRQNYKTFFAVTDCAIPK